MRKVLSKKRDNNSSIDTRSKVKEDGQEKEKQEISSLVDSIKRKSNKTLKGRGKRLKD